VVIGGGDVLDASISPDGKTLLFIREDAGSISIWVSSPPGAKPTAYPPSVFDTKDYRLGTLKFSPDGSKIALTLSPRRQTGVVLQLWVLPFPKGKPRRLLQGSSDPVPFHNVSWMPDSRNIVLTGYYEKSVSLWMVDIGSGRIQRLTAGSQQEESPVVSSDGNRIAYTVSDKNFDLVEIPLDGSPLRHLLTTSQDERDPAWSPDGTQYAYVTSRSGVSEIWMRSKKDWDRPVITQKNFGEDFTAMFSTPRFSPDGSRISYFRTGAKVKDAIWVSAVAGGPPVLLASGYWHSWSPDGEWIAFIEGTVDGFLSKVRVGGTDQKVRLSRQRMTGESRSMAWSPTGEWISYPVAGKGLSIVSPDGKTSRLLNKPNPIVGGWSKDGQMFYGIFRRENRSLVLAGIDVKTVEEKMILDLGFAYSSFRGFSLATDGKSFITSVEREEGDLWILEGFPKPRRFFDFFSLKR
jgi:Tol biopolymer transport system component